jgi:hypothetical protein
MVTMRMIVRAMEMNRAGGGRLEIEKAGLRNGSGKQADAYQQTGQ